MGGKSKSTQVVSLTATLPPTDESRFFDGLGWRIVRPRSQDCKSVDEEDERRTHRVLGYERGQLEEALERLVEEKMGAEGGGNMAVHCKTIAEAKRRAKLLGCRTY